MGKQRTDDLAEKCTIPTARMRDLLEAGCELELVQRRRGDHWSLGTQGAVLQADAGLRAMSLHHRAFYQDMTDPLVLLRGASTPTHLAKFWPYAGERNPERSDSSEVTPYSDLMGQSQAMIAEQVLDAYPLAEHGQVLDVGGGDGSFIRALAANHPHLKFGLFDLPAVTSLARERFIAAGLNHRVDIHSGNFHTDSLPVDQECISLVRILHDHDDEPAAALLRRTMQALKPGGTLLIAEPMLNSRRKRDTVGNYFRFYLLAMGSGRPRAAAEVESMLVEAGFVQPQNHATNIPMICSVISARKAK